VSLLHLHETKPEFSVERVAGDVELQIRASGIRVHITVGGLYEDVSLLAESLRHLVQDIEEDILDGWEDTPDEFDGSISVERGRYHASLDGTRVGDYPTRDVAEIELARSMVAGGVFPNAWFITDHGNYVDINDGGDQTAPLADVQYHPGDRVRHAESDRPQIVADDWGPAGVEIHTDGDPTIRTHITDRSSLRPDT
jgi:hypothetical protein